MESFIVPPSSIWAVLFFYSHSEPSLSGSLHQKCIQDFPGLHCFFALSNSNVLLMIQCQLSCPDFEIRDTELGVSARCYCWAVISSQREQSSFYHESQGSHERQLYSPLTQWDLEVCKQGAGISAASRIDNKSFYFWQQAGFLHQGRAHWRRGRAVIQVYSGGWKIYPATYRHISWWTPRKPKTASNQFVWITNPGS